MKKSLLDAMNSRRPKFINDRHGNHLQ